MKIIINAILIIHNNGKNRPITEKSGKIAGLKKGAIMAITNNIPKKENKPFKVFLSNLLLINLSFLRT